MRRRLADIAARFADGQNPATKHLALYDLYQEYVGHLADEPVALLELGVHSGESIKTFATFFERGTVIGVDHEDRGLSFGDFPNVRFARCDQRDAAALAGICRTLAPGGLDIVIDDASHIGAWSLASYEGLFPHLKAGGLYVVEDWGTGYWDDWPDGSRFQRFPPEPTGDEIGKRLPSHDFGMVGFVKSLVDEVMSDRIRPSATAPMTRPARLDLMSVHQFAVVLRKAGGPRPS